MSDRTLTYDDLGRLLVQLGFVRGQTSSNHQVLKHDPSDTVVLLPPSQPSAAVDAIHFLTVRKTVVDRGAVDADVYDRALENMKSGVLSRA